MLGGRMRSNLIIFGLLALVLAVPFLLQDKGDTLGEADETLVIITPHAETIRHEFEEGFRKAYMDETGDIVDIDWRTPGGTSEIAKYLNGAYVGAFRNYWMNDQGKEWSQAIESGFNNRKLKIEGDGTASPPVIEARKAFLTSAVSSDIDVFFGGGSYDHYVQAGQGHVVDSGIFERYPDWFGDGDNQIPSENSGEYYYDTKGRWIGAALSSFGIIYNRDGLERVGMPSDIDQWVDLGDPKLIGEVASADPTKSGSATKAFEMIIQQRMQQVLAERQAAAEGAGEAFDDDAKAAALALGWLEGMRLIQRVSANARYFTDSASRAVIDVANGDCAAGMAIDFYGRYQEETIRMRGGNDRFRYVTPLGGSTVSVDPISLLRGAPNEPVAKAFIDFVLSPDGQKLWNFEVGTPGGPEQYALRRMPVRRDFYTEENRQYRSDPDIYPYEDAKAFVYQGGWTASLFDQIRFIIRYSFIDVHDELVGAWSALIEHDFPPEATALFNDLSAISYDAAQTTISARMNAESKIEEVRLARELSDHFRKRYAEVRMLAYQGR